jgi:hypothetical protein
MKKHKNPPFVMVTNQVLDAPAWKAMSMGARCLYIALKRRYSPNGKNNGKIRLSQREAREQLGAGFTQIARWFAELQYYGFIVMMEAGCLGLDGKGKAPSWRLTEVGYMRGKSSPGMEDMPTMNFLKWNGVRFSKHCPGGDHLKPKPETDRSRKPEHTASRGAPENRSISYKPSGEGGRGSLSDQPQTPVREASGTREDGHDAAPAAEAVPVKVTSPKRHRGRPTIGLQPMTAAERKRRERARRREGNPP